ncbi:MAG: hypothetical protein K9G11_03440, partial [Rickettsiaceae bacterium]|nr:hypothetical protein [Rickettsiaceae bacterium]
LDKEGRAALDGKSFVDKIGEAQKLREFQEDYAKRYREIEKTKVEAKSPIEPKNMSEYVSGDERFRTKKEQLVEDKLKLESKELQKRIDALEADQSSMFGRLKGLDKNKNYAEILELEKQKLNYSIHSDLSKDKIILGSRYMSEDMTREIAQEKLQQLDAKYKATLQQDKYLKDSKKYLDELQKLSGKRESYEALDVGEKAAPKGIREEREKTEQEFKRISDLVNFNEDRKRQIDEVFGQYRDKLAAKVDGDLDGKSSIPKPARNKVDGDLDGKSSISKPAGNKVDGDLDGKSSIPKPAGNKDDVKFAGSVDRMLNPQFLDQDLIESRFGDFVPSGTKAAYDQNTPELLEREGKEKEGPSERDADEYRVRKNSVQSDLSQVLTEATLLNVTPPTAEGAVEELVKVTDKIRKQQDFIEGIESAVEASYAASNLAQDEPESLSPKISTILDDDTKPAAPVRLNDEVRLRRIVKTPPDALPPKGSSKESSPQNGGDDSE